MTAAVTKTATPTGWPAATFNRILDEGYGPGAWYGSDLRASIGDVSAAAAFKRPAQGRHNIAEVALHHAYWAGQIAGKLTGETAAQFPLDGEDWFELNDESTLTWKKVAAALDASQQRLSQVVAEIASGARTSPLGEAERFDLVIGITGHAAYHAGQIQLIKKLI
jgi:uncharacterized damage-inducible protein DinB